MPSYIQSRHTLKKGEIMLFLRIACQRNHSYDTIGQPCMLFFRFEAPNSLTCRSLSLQCSFLKFLISYAIKCHSTWGFERRAVWTFVSFSMYDFLFQSMLYSSELWSLKSFKGMKTETVPNLLPKIPSE